MVLPVVTIHPVELVAFNLIRSRYLDGMVRESDQVILFLIAVV